MIVSWNWLAQYVDLDMLPEVLEERLAMSGLNHEGTEHVADDLAIDLEVTSNRPDCLGHVGVAREVSVLWNTPLRIPDVDDLPEQGPDAASLIDVSIEDLELCPQYSARVIQGVNVGPSPDWLVQRLAAVGQASVNNVVDITNYVLLESGQPLHAFDHARLKGPKIIVRRARQGEQIESIDHKLLELTTEMCVIADAERPVAIAGVMGGVDTEVGSHTTDLLIESAEFNQLATRTTSRRLKLPSESSYRFERGVDPQGVEWASRRCCQLILELAGGTLAKGVVTAGEPGPAAPPVVLRLSQLPRVLGIEVKPEEVARISAALGFEVLEQAREKITVQPPSWRRDCTREIDLIEEVARIHGYDQIPEDSRVPMAASHKTSFDLMLERVRQMLVGAGFYEAMTVSVASESWNRACNPWGSRAEIVAEPSMLRGEDRLRQSIVPSLLNARKYNDARGNADAHFFETARVFLADEGGHVEEPWMLALVGGHDYRELKGVLESLVERLGCTLEVDTEQTPPEPLAPGRSAWLKLNGRLWGYVGEVSDAGLKQFGLQRGATVAEVQLGALAEVAQLVPQDKAISTHPAMTQDLNFIVPDSLTWIELERQVRPAAAQVARPSLTVEEVDDWEALQRLLADGGGPGARLRERLAAPQRKAIDGGKLDDGQRQAVVNDLNAAIQGNEPPVDPKAIGDKSLSEIARNLLKRKRLSDRLRARLHRQLIEDAAGGAVAEQNSAELESVAYKETYVDAQQDGPGRKRLLLSITLRSMISTLTGKQAEEVREAIVESLKKLDAQLLG